MNLIFSLSLISYFVNKPQLLNSQCFDNQFYLIQTCSNQGMQRQQLGRFYRSSFSIQVLVCLIFIALFIKECVKFFKQQYLQYQDANVANHNVQQTENNITRPKSVEVQSMLVKIGTRMERAFNRLPFFSLVLLNIVLISSYQFIAITAYLYILCLVVLICIDIQNPTAKFITEFIPIIFIFCFLINTYTITRNPSLFA